MTLYFAGDIIWTVVGAITSVSGSWPQNGIRWNTWQCWPQTSYCCQVACVYLHREI